VTLNIQRNGPDMSVDLVTAASPSNPSQPVVGVTISTYMFNVQTPFQVDITSDNVGGPSAGFMFALAILDGVTAGDLTRGYYVAGTGTIARDGTVGPIGGAAEKALAAEQAGAQIFLVPKANADEAHRWVTNLQIVPVEHLDDAVKALCALPPITDRLASPETPTPCG
jgi:PDZ domain-containing protein